MIDAPERIWIDGACADNNWMPSKEGCLSPHGPYIREDLHTAEIARLTARVAELEGAATGNAEAVVKYLADEWLHCCDAEAFEIAARISTGCQHPDGVQVLEDAEAIFTAAARAALTAQEARE